MSKTTDDINKRLNFQIRLENLITDDDNARSRLPDKIGISPSTFSRAANYGIIPKTKTLMKIADYFNVSIDFLLNKTDDENFINSELGKNFYDRVDELKNELGFKNYSKLANQIHLPRQYFNDWLKRNVYPTTELLEYLADYFKVSIDYLLGRTDYKN